MNSIIERFGDFVGKKVPQNPETARKLLLAALKLSRAQNRYLPDKKLMSAQSKLAVLSADAVIKPLQNGERSAVVNIFMPCEILHALGLEPQIAEGLACYFSAAGSEQAFVRAAHDFGVPETLCSYQKILTGIAASGVLPKPKLVANTTLACDANTSTFRTLASIFGAPHFTVDVPNEYSEASLNYVAEQLREFGQFAEEASGVRLEESKLRACVANSCKAQKLYSEYLERFSTRYVTNEMTTEMYMIFAMHILLGKTETAEVLDELVKETALQPKYRGGDRILWVHSVPYWQDSFRNVLNFSEKHQFLCSDMSFDALCEMDPDSPYESMARRILVNTFNGNTERRGAEILKRAKQIHADKVIYFCHWGCRNTAGGVKIIKDMLENEGLSVLVLDGDGCDRSNINDGQMLTRLTAFLENTEE